MTFRITPFKHKPLEVSEAFSCVELDSLLSGDFSETIQY